MLKKYLFVFFVALQVNYMDLFAQNPNLVINEFVAVNDDILSDSDGDNSDWIEIWNKGATPINLAGYHLTDDQNKLDKWTFPSVSIGENQFLVVFASNKDRRVEGQELHTNFKLSSGGEFLGLIDPDGTTVIFEYAPEYPVQFDNVAFGLESSTGAFPAKYLDSATPGAANSQGSDLYKAENPSFSVERGSYTSAFNLQLDSSQGLQIRYTIDGTAPSENIGIAYSGPFLLSSTTTIRAIAYGPGVNPSDIETHTFIFLNEIISNSNMSTHVGASDQEMEESLLDIPSVFLTSPNITYTDSDDNFEEHAVSVEYWNPDGSEPGFQIDAGFQTWGGYSSYSPKKHYRLEFKSEYGESKLRYPIFDTDPTPYVIPAVEEFDKLLLRGGSQDGLNGAWGDEKYAQFIRNQFMFDLQRGMGYFTPHGRWVHVYLNGEYMGFYNLLERPDEKFFSAYYGNSDDQYEVKKTGRYWAGTGSFFNAMTSSLNNLNTEAAFENARDYIDMQQTADYLILNRYGAAWDWSTDRNNLGGGDINPGNGGYKYIVWDVDLSLGNGAQWQYDDPSLDRSSYYGPISSRLYNNEEFQMLWSDRMECHFYNGGIMTPDSLRSRYNLRADQVRTALLAESARWGDVRYTEYSARDVPEWKSTVHWESELNRVNNLWFGQRGGYVIQHEKSRGIFPSIDAVTFNQYGGIVPSGFQMQLSSPSGGEIYYTTDGSDPRLFGGGISGSASVYTGAVPITSVTSVNARAYVNGTWSAMCPRDFYPSGYYSEVSFNEIHYNPLDEGNVGLPDYIDGDNFEFVELKNHGSSTVDMSGLEISDGVKFTFPEGTMISPGEFIVLARDADLFASRYSFPPFGVYTGKLENSGERIELITPYGAILDSLTFGDSDPWPSEPDGNGYSLSLDPISDANNSDPDLWLPSSSIHGSPNAENVTNFRPSVTLTAPNDGQTFSPGTPIQILIDASDVNDSVDSVRVELGNLAIGTDDSEPFEVAWAPPPGEYQIFARAWDTYRSEASSDSVTIFVQSQNACVGVPNILINEINYNDDDDNGPLTGDWLEIFNPTDTAVDLEGWTFKDIKNENWLVIPAGISIPAYGYHVLVQDLDLFSQVHTISNKTGSFGFGLDGSGDHLRLYAPSGCLVDEVFYDDESPWPLEADGLGKTLELVNATGDNAEASEWQASGSIGGSPGRVNSGLEISVDLLTPANNTGIASGATMIVTARVNSGASVSSVEVYLNGAAVGQMEVDPSDSSLYSYEFTNLGDGIYNIHVVATNASSQFDNSNTTSVCIGELGTGAFVETGGQVVFEAELFSDKINRGADSWELGDGNAGYVGGGYMITVPDNGTKVTSGYAETATELQYPINFETTGTYYLWFRGWADDGSNNSVHFGLDGSESPFLGDVNLGVLNFGTWSWGGTITDGTRARVDVSTPGIHTISLWMREDGTKVDRVVMTTDPNFTPSGEGPVASAQELSKIRLNARIYLSGAFDVGSGMMRTNLNLAELLPLNQPYSDVTAKSVGQDFFANNPRVVDWVWLELRTGEGASTAVHKEAFLLRDDGWLLNSNGSLDLGISGLEDDNYYLVIGHRNHLAAMTSNMIALESANLLNVDLSTDLTAIYSIDDDPVKLMIDGVYGLWSGDANGNTEIKYTASGNDRVEVVNVAGGPTPFDTASGYYSEDVNLDGIVKYAGANNDRVEILDNAGGPTAFDSRKDQVPD